MRRGVAPGIVHIGLPFDANIAPPAMLSGAMFLLFRGPGPFALDARRRAAPAGTRGGAVAGR